MMRAAMLGTEAAEWRDFLNRTPHDFYHLPDYVRLDAQHQGGRACAFLAEEDEHGLLVPLIVRPIGSSEANGATGFDAISPYGFGSPLFRPVPGGDPHRFVRSAMHELRRELRERGVVSAFSRLHPLLPMPQELPIESGHVVQHGDTVLLDLTLTPEQMWQQTRENHRRGIRRAEKLGYAVEVDERFTAIETFHEIYTETMRRVGAGRSYLFSLDYFRELADRLGDHLHLCLVRHGREVACGGLFTETCGIVQYHLGGTRDAYLNHQPSKLMFHFVREWARQRGNHVLSLGAGVGGRNDELFHFKAGFSPLCAPFSTWRLVVDDCAYRHLVGAWEARHQTIGDGLSGFFPAYRKAVPSVDAVSPSPAH